MSLPPGLTTQENGEKLVLGGTPTSLPLKRKRLRPNKNVTIRLFCTLKDDALATYDYKKPEHKRQLADLPEINLAQKMYPIQSWCPSWMMNEVGKLKPELSDGLEIQLLLREESD